MFDNIYKDKKFLITGDTGFKGSWLAIWLLSMGADVVGISLPPQNPRVNYVVCGLRERITHIDQDIRDYDALCKIFDGYSPDVVFHLAAQAIVLEGYQDPLKTHSTNFMGTVNVLEAIRHTESVKAGVIITTDKCYENREWVYGYRETDRLGGNDPYSASKAACEMAVASYTHSFFNDDNSASIASARAGNVIGGGDWAENRIVPDCVRALEKDAPIIIRNPYAVRPWQHVLEPLSGYLKLGSLLYTNAKEFAEFCGVKYCVGLNSCTAALDMALKLLGVNHGDEVIVPTMTFVSIGHCVAYNLATPIFADIDEDTLNIDIDDVARKISSRTKAIIPVHYGGRPVDMDKLREVAGNIPIIEDCAHASGAKYKGKPVGGLGEIGCFSFHAVKNLAMGEGGAITLNDEAMAQRAKRNRWLGIDKGTWDRTKMDRSYWWEYNVDEIGLKSHLNDISAAIGLVQLRKLEKANLRRRQVVDMYREGLKELSQVKMPPEDGDDFISSWHLCEIKVQNRNDLSVFLRDKDINTGVHYKPIHLYRCYGNRPSLPIAEKVFSQILTLPLYPDLSDDEVNFIIDTIKAFYRNR